MKRTRIFAGAAVAALLIAAATAAARADEIKAGKWEFTTEMSMPGMGGPGITGPGGNVQLPPGVKLPPGVQMQSTDNGMKMTSTSCIAPDRAVPKMPKNNSCKVDKMERHGGNVKWTITCKMPNGAMHSKGNVTYHGDTMEGTVTNAGSMNGGTNGGMMGGAPMNMDMTQHITGKYLGKCD